MKRHIPSLPECREPPLPHFGAPKGYCRWCGEPVLYPVEHKRAGEVQVNRRWHGECTHQFGLATNQGYLRHYVYERDHGRCATCGRCGDRHVAWRQGVDVKSTAVFSDPDRGSFTCVIPVKIGWIADHKTPLWLVHKNMLPRYLDGRMSLQEILWFWSLGNVQTLCKSCSRVKTAAEAKERSKFVRIRAKQTDRRSKTRKRRDAIVARMEERNNG